MVYIVKTLKSFKPEWLSKFGTTELISNIGDYCCYKFTANEDVEKWWLESTIGVIRVEEDTEGKLQ